MGSWPKSCCVCFKKLHTQQLFGLGLELGLDNGDCTWNGHNKLGQSNMTTGINIMKVKVRLGLGVKVRHWVHT